jgi:putative FmdB family regulatory protein
VPTYSYACTECDNRFDIVQSFSDDTLTVCPACSGKLRKLFNSVGIVFKGSGFYRNDSRDTKSSATTAASSSDSNSEKSSTPDAGAKKSEKSSSDAPKASSTQAVAS